MIFIVADAPREKRFFDEVLGFDKLSDNLLTGPEIERMVGLPPGAGLDVSIWGRDDVDLGGLEIIEYQGVDGEDRYSRAVPGATGVLHVTAVLPDVGPLLGRLKAAGVAVDKRGNTDTLVGTGETFRFATPAGLTLEVIQTAD